MQPCCHHGGTKNQAHHGETITNTKNITSVQPWYHQTPCSLHTMERTSPTPTLAHQCSPSARISTSQPTYSCSLAVVLAYPVPTPTAPVPTPAALQLHLQILCLLLELHWSPDPVPTPRAPLESSAYSCRFAVTPAAPLPTPAAPVPPLQP